MMNSTINTDNINTSLETPTLTADTTTNTLVGSIGTTSLNANTSVNTLVGSIGSGVIGSGIKTIYLNNVLQNVVDDKAYIELYYNMIYDLPTIPTKTSDLENDSGYINSGYVTTNEFTSLSNQVGIIQNQIPTITNNIEEIETSIEEINDTLTNKVNTNDFNTLQTQVTNNTNNIGTNTTNIQTNTNNITTLQNIVDAQSQSITSATELIEDNADNIETLQTDVSSINTALSNKVDTSTFNVLDAQVQTNTSAIAGKQDTLVSGTNIKTINNQSLLGSGDISISGGQATDVQINGTSITSNNTANIQTFSTYNANTNKIATMNDLPVIPTIPTKTSDLTNDSGFITNTVNDLTNYTLTSNLSAVATSGDYNDLSNLPTIPTVPTNVSAFTNDAGYITATNYASRAGAGTISVSAYFGTNVDSNSGALFADSIAYATYQTKANQTFVSKGTLENVLTGKGFVSMSTLSVVATTGDYNDLNNLPSIPTATSDLTNDSGFITNKYNDASILFDTSKRIAFTPRSGQSYANYGGCYYYKVNSMVYVSVGISGLSANTNTTIYTLPAGYRPSHFIASLGVGNSLAQYSFVQVSSDGNIVVRTQGSFALVSICFDAVQ